MAQAPCMPLWTDALIGDTTHLSTREFGAYMLLLIATWRNNGRPFPDSDKMLARICRMQTYEWKNQIRSSLEPFFDLAEGLWRQKRLEKEWSKSAARRASLVMRGMRGGRPKSKPLEINETGKAIGSSQLSPNKSPTFHNHNHNHVGSNEPTLFTDRSNDLSPSKQALRTRQLNKEFETVWPLYPRHVGKGAANKAWHKARQSASDETLRDAIERLAQQHRGDEARYIPHMATWLNQTRWLDGDPEEASNGYDGPTEPAPKPEFWKDPPQAMGGLHDKR
jgi:uncharacterized protein YdaU (DUF1376 family)